MIVQKHHDIEFKKLVFLFFSSYVYDKLWLVIQLNLVQFYHLYFLVIFFFFFFDKRGSFFIFVKCWLMLKKKTHKRTKQLGMKNGRKKVFIVFWHPFLLNENRKKRRRKKRAEWGEKKKEETILWRDEFYSVRAEHKAIEFIVFHWFS